MMRAEWNACLPQRSRCGNGLFATNHRRARGGTPQPLDSLTSLQLLPVSPATATLPSLRRWQASNVETRKTWVVFPWRIWRNCGMLQRIFLVALSLGIVASSLNAGEKPPNFVVILADDLGYGDLGCYGSTTNQTPNIDVLAGEGLRFTDFHSAGPMCSPTRAAILTGLYQQRFGRVFDSALSGRAHRDLGLPKNALTIAELLKTHGYTTACFGKWHLGYQPPHLPPDHGFDEFRGLVSGDGDFHTRIDRSGNEDWWHGNEIKMEAGYTTDLLTQYSVDFIERHREKPFFLYIPHLAIHFPWQGPEDPPHRKKDKTYHDDKWGIIPDRSNVAPHVKAMVEALDLSVGKVMKALKDGGLDEETFVLFTSDNGGYLTYGSDFRQISSNGPFRGQKTELYEGGHRVPTIARWPGKIRIGESHATAHSIDLFPTLATLAGIEPTAYRTDGIDLAPSLLRNEALPNRHLFWRADESWAVRHGSWKLCVENGERGLYDLSKDPGESHNLAVSHPEPYRLLKEAWNSWEREVNASAGQAALIASEAQPFGGNGSLQFYHYSRFPSDQRRDLYIHFHGAPAVVADNFAKSKLEGVLAVINFNGLSAAYGGPFQNDTDLFDNVLDRASRSVSMKEDESWQRVAVSSFSAGYGAVRQLLKNEAAFDRIDALLAADSLYASLEAELDTRRPLAAHMRDYTRFARRAAAGEKIFVLTHSAQETSYASTTETADYLLEAADIKRRLVEDESRGPLQPASTATAGNFKVFGYHGIQGEDHLLHLRLLYLWWPHLSPSD